MSESWAKTLKWAEYNEDAVACPAECCELSLSLHSEKTAWIHPQSFLNRNARKNTMQELAEIVTV